ncbi:Crp/Fnr family transcriptional regulator [Paenibacillus mucilaginosus]|uniref:Transcription regulator Crp family protein n=3 Tax=Paenibacillus mucilaginosus TaxID=61624 RepID=H6NB81_9BACL|nr:Crp/Fnr family transcriptional regulator [Paenibacillus mucilaginosus]AEI42508.1 Transcription regulator Crp family protein [Paenibacillus mucilaginosus KNP414]AFC32049.1 transcription regulator Crp family protein [Paenibacillus mucilaginosus 3016]AFH64419.1 regulatory protein [Paenibacillus mucilaginosus K02]MCG7213901.1 Crp/Fnr family transcriptional regulator [Paenibacillus mucilaginosus]WDM25907.1 Crp/Fnr family transcriptional regulator [Paenibacillus mucilaginosus]
MTDTKQGGMIRHKANSECFSSQNLDRLKATMYEMNVKAGDHLFWEGDPADKLYYVKSGSVRITKDSGDGKHFILYTHGEGDLFGQLDPFQASLHSFNAETLEDSVIGAIQQKDLDTLLWQHGDLAVEFMKWMGLMHRMTQTKFRDLMMFGKPGALCSTLIRLCNSYGEKQGDAIRITRKVTNTELAEMIGSTRESVNRMLSDLKKADVVTLEGGYTIVKDLSYLRDICQCENCPLDMCRI